MSYILKLLKNNFLLALLSFMKSKNWVNRQKNDQFVKKAKQLGIKRVYITTNGALANIEKVTKCIDAGLDSIKFSINASNREEYKTVHGYDDFDKVINKEFPSTNNSLFNSKVSEKTNSSKTLLKSVHLMIAYEFPFCVFFS